MPRKTSVRHKAQQDLKLREMLGLSQPEMAEFCGVSKSMLSMIELGLRNWPSGTSVNHSLLLGAFFEAENNPPDLAEPETPKDWQVAAWQKEIRQLRYEIKSLERNMEDLVFRFRQARRLYQTCVTVRKHFPDQDQTENLVLNLWMHKAEIKMRENGPMAQELFQLKIESAEKRIAVLEKWTNKSKVTTQNSKVD